MSVPLVLVVEPDADCRQILSALIAHAGYRVVEASAATEGLDSAMRLSPAVIVGEHPLWLDEATTLCRALRNDPATAEIPFVAVTSRALAEELECARQGHAHVFTKPPDYGEVIRVVSDLAERTADHGQQIRKADTQERQNAPSIGSEEEA